jgi:hypothetical protein
MTIRISFADKTVRVAVEINGAIESKITELPQRPWVGLTDEEFEHIELGCRSTPFGKIEAMQKVEAKLRSKNT